MIQLLKTVEKSVFTSWLLVLHPEMKILCMLGLSFGSNICLMLIGSTFFVNALLIIHCPSIRFVFYLFFCTSCMYGYLLGCSSDQKIFLPTSDLPFRLNLRIEHFQMMDDKNTLEYKVKMDLVGRLKCKKRRVKFFSSVI